MKRISDDVRSQIIKAREEEGLSLYEITKRFGHPKSTIFNIIRYCDSSKVKKAAPHRRVVDSVTPKARPNLSKTDLGEAARQMILARLMLSGVTVFRPMTEDTPIDLLVFNQSGKTYKCQCKYIYPVKGNKGHLMNFCASRPHYGKNEVRVHRYTQVEVDFFLGYCQDNDAVYVIPFKAVEGKGSVIIWVLRKPQNQNDKESFDSDPWKNAFHLLIDDATIAQR